MLHLYTTKLFEKKLKRYKHNHKVQAEFKTVVSLLLKQELLPAKYRDHALKGSFNGYTNVRELHLRPDDLLVYFIVENDSLTLVDIGSHSQLF